MINSQFRIVAIIMLFIISACEMYAVPAYPHKITVLDACGREVEVYVRGDENIKYAITLDGYTLLSNTEGWWYATVADNGDIVKSDFMLVAKGCESAELLNFKSTCPKGLLPSSCKSDTQSNKATVVRKSVSQAPLLGERRALVILMQYHDVKFKKTKEDFERLFNLFGYKENNATGSVRDYYKFASQGQLDYISDVYGPYTSKFPMSYYGANTYVGGNDRNPLELCIEAIKSLPTDIDYSSYDNDDDGLVDNVHIVFAGYGEEAGATSDAIWAHEFPYRISLDNEVGISIEGYSCSPELSGNYGANITNIGVICHELGHALGAMDYYDTNYGTGGDYVGTGIWDIMASGSWNDGGRTPANFNPYVRCFVFGWNSLVVLNNNNSITMPRMELGNAYETPVYKMETGDSGDYFLLENRQKCDFDAALPGQGLMIYHVHPDIDRCHSSNTVNSTHPQCLYPVCAAYSDPQNKEYGNINSAACPFPGSNYITEFSSETNPLAIAWDGSPAKLSISDITMHNDGTVTFVARRDSVPDIDDSDKYEEMNLIYDESFEQDIYNRMTVYSILGKEQWKPYKDGDFVLNGEHLPEATDGKTFLMLYSGKNICLNESEVVGPGIEVVPDNKYLISFDVYCKALSTSLTPYLNLIVEDDSGVQNIYTLNEDTNGWKSVEIPLAFVGNKFNYKFYGRVFSGGLFIDNIKLYEEGGITLINPDIIFETDKKDVVIYRLDGTCLGKYDDNVHLASGMYIIRRDGCAKKILISR